MQHNDYWDHNCPDGTKPWEFFRLTDYNYAAAGENLARGFVSESAMHDAWMNSPEHRANIMRSGYQHIGVAVDSMIKEGDKEVIVVVVHFGAQHQEDVGSKEVESQFAKKLYRGLIGYVRQLNDHMNTTSWIQESPQRLLGRLSDVSLHTWW